MHKYTSKMDKLDSIPLTFSFPLIEIVRQMIKNMPLEYPGEGANEGLMFQITDYKLSRKSFFRIETTLCQNKSFFYNDNTTCRQIGNIDFSSSNSNVGRTR